MFDESSSGSYSWIVYAGIDSCRSSGMCDIWDCRYPDAGTYPLRVRFMPIVPPV
jgi:hypothetical protein